LRNALEAPRPDIAQAREEAAALDRLVQHHLARARTAALAAATATASVAPHAIAEEVAGALRRLFADRGLSVAVDGDRGARVRMDPQDLTELLGNLMENACKWARESVTVTIAAVAGEVVVTVADDGSGLPEAERDTVVGRGIRLDGTRDAAWRAARDRTGGKRRAGGGTASTAGYDDGSVLNRAGPAAH
jgi:signal transduction histidine kinase